MAHWEGPKKLGASTALGMVRQHGAAGQAPSRAADQRAEDARRAIALALMEAFSAVAPMMSREGRQGWADAVTAELGKLSPRPTGSEIKEAASEMVATHQRDQEPPTAAEFLARVKRKIDARHPELRAAEAAFVLARNAVMAAVSKTKMAVRSAEYDRVKDVGITHMGICPYPTAADAEAANERARVALDTARAAEQAARDAWRIAHAEYQRQLAAAGVTMAIGSNAPAGLRRAKGG